MMKNKKVSNLERFNLQNNKERTMFDSNQLKKASGIYEFNQNSSSTYEEVTNMSEYIRKDTFEQFEKRIDDKLDNLPERMADKIDAKISGLEARQTKWFVGIAITAGIGTLSLLIGAIGVLVSIFI